MSEKTMVYFLILLLMMFGLSIVILRLNEAKGDEYTVKVLAQNNYSSTVLPFKRGDILDRNGVTLATSIKVYNLILDPKLILEIAKVIRLGFLQQNAFHKDDTCVSLEKQFKMMDVILYLYKTSRKLVAMGMPMSVLKAEGIFEKVIAIKYDVPNDRLDMFDQYMKDIDTFYDEVIEKNA